MQNLNNINSRVNYQNIGMINNMTSQGLSGVYESEMARAEMDFLQRENMG